MSLTKDILIIDDEATIVDFMTEALTDEGYAVRAAQDAQQGLSQIEALPPALVLLDLHMPGMSTIELVEHVRSNGFSTLPLVIMTADQSAPKYLADCPDFTYLFKPFDLDTLMECVSRFIPPSTTR